MGGIRHAVGRGGTNRYRDVLYVQQHLNHFLVRCGGRPIAEDGDCGRRTNKAIGTFQQEMVRGIRPDGRIDPGGQTLRALERERPGRRDKDGALEQQTSRFRLGAGEAHRGHTDNGRKRVESIKPSRKKSKEAKTSHAYAVERLPAGQIFFPVSGHSRTYHFRPGCRFGAHRKKSRRHAGCDLYAPAGSPVYAIADGVVHQGPYGFYEGRRGVAYAIEIWHPGVSVTARYGEVQRKAAVHPGERVVAGQIIGFVSGVTGMLHFELYDRAPGSSLTVRSNRPYQRRKDLINPTAWLDGARIRAA